MPSYNNYPVSYSQPYMQPYQAQPMYPQPMYSPYQGAYQPQPQPQQTMPQPVQQTIQSGGFIPVQSIEEARNYPVAPGNSVTFKDENAPRVYTKTMGFSQLDRPIFEIYKLVKEVEPMQVVPVDIQPVGDPAPGDSMIREELASIRRDIDEMKKRLSGRFVSQIDMSDGRGAVDE